jgi:hypothetical protein
MIRRPAFPDRGVHKASIWKAANQGPLEAFPAQSIEIEFGNVKDKRGSFVDPSSVAHKLVATKSGLYVISFQVWTTGGSAGGRNFGIYVGASSVFEVGMQSLGRQGWSFDPVFIAAGGEVGVRCYPEVANVTIAGSAAKDTALAMEYVGQSA